MKPEYIGPLLVVSFSALVQATVVIRYLYRKMRTDDMIRVFVRDVARNHLPHMYHTLTAIAKINGLVLTEPPPIRWIDRKEFENGDDLPHK